MIHVHKTTDYNSILKILENPVLFDCTSGQNGDIDLEDIKKREWLLVTDNMKIIGCFEIKEFTRVCIEGHIYVLPSHWKQSKEIMAAAFDWCLDNKYKTVFTCVPANCLHILKFVNKIGFKAAGQIPKGVIFNKELVTLFLFTYDLEV